MSHFQPVLVGPEEIKGRSVTNNTDNERNATQLTAEVQATPGSTGGVKSSKKAAAARANGTLGGRPAKLAEDFSCTCGAEDASTHKSACPRGRAIQRRFKKDNPPLAGEAKTVQSPKAVKPRTTRKNKAKKLPSNPMSAMRAARIAAGYTPEAAAKKLGKCRDYVMQLERAGMGPYLFNMRAAQLYGVSVNLFVYCPKNTKIGNIIVNPDPAPDVPVNTLKSVASTKREPKTKQSLPRPRTKTNTEYHPSGRDNPTDEEQNQ